MTRPDAVAERTDAPISSNPWNALWAMMIGFFMILVDSTIVAVANPNIMEKLQTDYDAVIWVTSAYLLAYAVPLLLAGRLGDQFGPKNLYLVGLFVFTAASLWCGLSGSIETLIAARVVQGIGAALLTPQTLSTITRIFPAERRGAAMSVWGATAGVATLVGPLAGGVLVDHLGWQWIFFVNVPIGILGLVLAVRLVPTLPTNRQRFDVLGVILSGAAMFLVVFGLQEGESQQWSAWIWGMVGGGVVAMLAFVWWQSVTKSEPLIPLRIFRDRNFSLANIGVAVIGFAVVAMVVPVMFYAQVVCDLSPTQSALLTAPMAVATGVLAPIVGKIVDRTHPRPIIGFGFSVLAIALTWLSVEMTATTPIWRLLLPFTAMGVGMAFIWAPLAATATRNLPGPMAGAGSGVYNATRQVGSVLGSAGIAAFMTSRISAEMPGEQGGPSAGGGAVELPEFLRAPFADALSQAVLLPAFVALFGVIAAVFFIGGFGPTQAVPVARKGERRDESDVDNVRTEVIPVLRDTSYDSPYRREFASQPDMFRHDEQGDWYADDGFADDDDNEHIEFTVDRADVAYPEPVEFADAADDVAADYDDDYDDDYDGDYGDTEDYGILDANAVSEEISPGDIAADESDTAPIATRVEHPRVAPAEVWRSTPVESWHSLLADAAPADGIAAPAPAPAQIDPEPGDPVQLEPIGFAHNGFHVDEEKKFQPLPPPRPPTQAPAPRRQPEPTKRDRYTDSFQWLVENIDNMSDRYSDLLPQQPRVSDRAAEQPRVADEVDNGVSAQYENSARHNGSTPAYESSSRHSHSEETDVRRPRHYREDAAEPESYGRHSLPGRD